MAKALQAMLERFGLKHRVLTVNADNASANNTQTKMLAHLNNSFQSVNHARCYNHTLQLSAKALLKPFSTSTAGSDPDSEGKVTDDAELLLILDDDLDLGADSVSKVDDVDDSIDELQELNNLDRQRILNEMVAVKTTIAKVSTFFFHHH
ncbi:hypothetical protein PAXRUDRAFT_152020 [Paxillus rubicundulus Ve08.2h10]|uniref:Uncharacterized protein n=1 Tax=Paxillus rubicundulus Ve08.2h10 TaxID=930991 RepID=A0A0D0DW76_9AGAM|nr:hypothetical protein PAXRUDRAFT_152020 [Paxillus rubicundulus Ve08.2h10]